MSFSLKKHVTHRPVASSVDSVQVRVVETGLRDHVSILRDVTAWLSDYFTSAARAASLEELPPMCHLSEGANDGKHELYMYVDNAPSQ